MIRPVRAAMLIGVAGVLALGDLCAAHGHALRQVRLLSFDSFGRSSAFAGLVDVVSVRLREEGTRIARARVELCGEVLLTTLEKYVPKT